MEGFDALDALVGDADAIDINVPASRGLPSRGPARPSMTAGTTARRTAYTASTAAFFSLVSKRGGAPEPSTGTLALAPMP